MRKHVKLIGVIMLLALIACGCKKEKQPTHEAIYEVVSADGSPIEITVGYYTPETEKELGAGQNVISVDYMEIGNNERIEVRTVAETSVTRWQHKFTLYYDEFLFYLIATINDEISYTMQKPIILKIYVDGNLKAEKQIDYNEYMDPTVSINYYYNETN